MFSLSKAINVNQLVEGAQLYRAFPFSNSSLFKLFVQLELIKNSFKLETFSEYFH